MYIYTLFSDKDTRIHEHAHILKYEVYVLTYPAALLAMAVDRVTALRSVALAAAICIARAQQRSTKSTGVEEEHVDNRRHIASHQYEDCP